MPSVLFWLGIMFIIPGFILYRNNNFPLQETIESYQRETKNDVNLVRYSAQDKPRMREVIAKENAILFETYQAVGPKYALPYYLTYVVFISIDLVMIDILGMIILKRIINQNLIICSIP